VIGGTLLTGGSGYVLGSVIGALVLGLMNVLITRDGTIPPAATTIITGGILLVFVLIQRVIVTQGRNNPSPLGHKPTKKGLFTKMNTATVTTQEANDPMTPLATGGIGQGRALAPE
jgi:hypothetical protein